MSRTECRPYTFFHQSSLNSHYNFLINQATTYAMIFYQSSFHLHLCCVCVSLRLVPRQFVYGHFVYDTSSTDISLQTFRLLLYTRVQDSNTSNFCFSKSLFSSIPTSTYTMIPFINPTSTDTMI